MLELMISVITLHLSEFYKKIFSLKIYLKICHRQVLLWFWNWLFFVWIYINKQLNIKDNNCSVSMFQVKFNPASPIELGDKYHSDILVQKHYQMSAIRLCMIQPAFSDPLQSYYVIADWEVDGHCFCYGHSNECTGPVSNFY